MTVQLKMNTSKPIQITWKTSNKSVVSVSSNGKIRAKKAGQAIITAKANGKTKKCKVTVSKAPGWAKKYGKIK